MLFNKKMRKKYGKVILFVETKSNTLEASISKVLIDSYISQDNIQSVIC